jgi:hypothetical protein
MTRAGMPASSSQVAKVWRKSLEAVQIHGLQQRVAGRGQRPPPLLTALADVGD